MAGEEHPAGFVIRELRRRRVGRVALAYVAVAYAVLEVAHVLLVPPGVPAWVFRALLGAAALGFPLATVLAWDYDITSRGIVRTDEVGEAAPLVPRPRLPWVSFVGFWFALGVAVRVLT